MHGPGHRSAETGAIAAMRALSLQPSSDDILPQFQDLDVGDVIPLGSGPSWPVIVADRNQALVVEPVAGAVSWAWLLTVLDASTARLIVMERQMLREIKRRAERLAQSAESGRSRSHGPARPGGDCRAEPSGRVRPFAHAGAVVPRRRIAAHTR